MIAAWIIFAMLEDLYVALICSLIWRDVSRASNLRGGFGPVPGCQRDGGRRVRSLFAIRLLVVSEVLGVSPSIRVSTSGIVAFLPSL